jgi:hypothetical protein
MPGQPCSAALWGLCELLSLDVYVKWPDTVLSVGLGRGVLYRCSTFRPCRSLPCGQSGPAVQCGPARSLGRREEPHETVQVRRPYDCRGLGEIPAPAPDGTDNGATRPQQEANTGSGAVSEPRSPGCTGPHDATRPRVQVEVAAVNPDATGPSARCS